MNIVANVLILIVFATVLYGTIFSKDSRAEAAPPARDRGPGRSPARPGPRPLPRAHVHLIAFGQQARFDDRTITRVKDALKQ